MGHKRGKVCKSCGHNFHACASCGVDWDWELHYCSYECYSNSGEYICARKKIEAIINENSPEELFIAVEYFFECSHDEEMIFEEVFMDELERRKGVNGGK